MDIMQFIMPSLCFVPLCVAAACVVVTPAASRAVASAPASAKQPPITVALNATSEDIVMRTNAERRAAGVPALRRDVKLMQAAQLHAEQMATSQRMSHDLPGAKYPAPADRIEAVGYAWSTYGENVAEGYPDAAGVVAGWMTSPGHRANILSSRFTEMGAGVATGANGRRYFAQVFGAPR